MGYGAMDASLLSEKAVLLMPSLTRILKSLEEQGAIERTRDSQDKRRTLISLTDQSRAAIATAAPSTIAAYADIEEQFGAEKMDLLLKLLDELAQVKPRQ